MVGSMKKTKHTRKLPKPSLFPGSNQDLNLDSTLSQLPLYDFCLETDYLGKDLADIFNKYPLLPGAILTEQGEFMGMISRQRFLEFLLRPQGWEMFFTQPLAVLYSYAHTEVLVLPGSTGILKAAWQAIKRSQLLQQEPIVVQLEPSVWQILDFTQLNKTAWQIRGVETQVRYERTQAQMLQSEKMASLGRLVDGIAHEILDPVSFIWGNLTHVSSYGESLLQLLSVYEQNQPQLSEEIIRLKEDIEFDFLVEDLPRAIESISSGAQRLKNLASSLQNFCHIDGVYPKPADLHACLESIILLLQSRLQSEIEIVRNYGNLPPLTCYISQISQVFMNILSNAVDALLNQAVSRKVAQEFGQRQQPSKKSSPRIEITTRILSRSSPQVTPDGVRWVSILISDNGPGISLPQQQRIRESFSIEKRADKETSLAVSYQIITAKHGGKLKMRSPISPGPLHLNQGTEFEILLPLV